MGVIVVGFVVEVEEVQPEAVEEAVEVSLRSVQETNDAT